MAEESACKWFLQFHNERPGPKPVFSMETMLFLHMSNQFDLGCLVLWWIELGNLHAIERKELNKDNPCTNCSLKLGRFYPYMFLYPPICLKAKRCFFFFSQANWSQLKFAKTRSKGDNLVESIPEATEKRWTFETGKHLKQLVVGGQSSPSCWGFM